MLHAVQVTGYTTLLEKQLYLLVMEYCLPVFELIKPCRMFVHSTAANTFLGLVEPETTWVGLFLQVGFLPVLGLDCQVCNTGWLS